MAKLGYIANVIKGMNTPSVKRQNPMQVYIANVIKNVTYIVNVMSCAKYREFSQDFVVDVLQNVIKLHRNGQNQQHYYKDSVNTPVYSSTNMLQCYNQYRRVDFKNHLSTQTGNTFWSIFFPILCLELNWKQNYILLEFHSLQQH